MLAYASSAISSVLWAESGLAMWIGQPSHCITLIGILTIVSGLINRDSVTLSRDVFNQGRHIDRFVSLAASSTAVTDPRGQVSDTASQDPSADRSGPTIKDLLLHEPTSGSDSQGPPRYTCETSAIVPDDAQRIRETILSWKERGNVDWIVTTGGTGFGVRDCTPEVSL